MAGQRTRVVKRSKVGATACPGGWDDKEGDSRVRRKAKASSFGPASSIRGLGALGSTACVCALAMATLVGTSASAGAAGCPNEAIRDQQEATHLSDCRAYELVSPPLKNGGNISASGGSVRLSVDGGTAVFDAFTAFSGANGTGVAGSASYRAVRSDLGWTTRGISPPQDPAYAAVFFGASAAGFSPDLSKGYFYSFDPPLIPNAPAGITNLYRQDYLSNEYQILTPIQLPFTPAHPLGFSDLPRFGAASSDGTHVIFESTKDLTANLSGDCNAPFAGCNTKLYEWTDGTLRLVGILPNGEPASGGSAGGAGGLAFVGGSYSAGLSDSGDQIYFTSPGANPGLSGATSGDLYVREDGVSTRKVNVSERSTPDPDGPKPATFQAMSRNGDLAFFTTIENLTNDAHGSVSDGPELYLYDATLPESAPSKLTLVSADSEPADGSAAGVLGILGASDNGRTVYFAATGRLLTSQPNTGKASIYRWHDGGASDELTYVGAVDRLNIKDQTNWTTSIFARKSSRVSADGGVLLYLSSFQPDGGGNGTAQFYRFSTTSSHVACVSCMPTGDLPAADASNTPTNHGVILNRQYAPRALSGAGNRVYFNTAAALIPRDTNGRSDVYEWTADDLRIISDGLSESDAYFADATPDGREVAFYTNAELVGWDVDENRDLYVAKADGGYPEPAADNPPCVADQCQGLPRSQPPVPTPATAALHSAGKRYVGADERCNWHRKMAARLHARADVLRHRSARLRAAARRAEDRSRPGRLAAARREARRAQRARREARHARQSAAKCRGSGSSATARRERKAAASRSHTRRHHTSRRRCTLRGAKPREGWVKRKAARQQRQTATRCGRHG